MSGVRLCNKLVVDHQSAAKILGEPKPVYLITTAGHMILKSPALENGLLTGNAVEKTPGSVISAVSVNPDHVVAYSFDYSVTEFEKISSARRARVADKEDDENE